MTKLSLLGTRNKMKTKKPEFERQDSNIFRQFRGTWRKPKGIHSKLRRGFRGHKNSPSIGYSSPTKVKGLSKKGFVPVLISNVDDLSKVGKDCVAVISRGVGTKKRLSVLAKAKEMKLTVLGVKDIDAFVSKVNEKRNLKKSQSDLRNTEKKKKVEDAEKNKDLKVEEKEHEPEK